MSFNTTVLPTIDFVEEMQDSTVVDQKIFAGNKIITNASPLINLVLKLRNKLIPKDALELKKKLIQEVKIFEDVISGYDYSSETILQARYGLCAFIDDLLMFTSWGIEVNWEHNGLLYAFDKESTRLTGKHFFTILKETSNNADQNIDLLELYYIFLTLGFGGKFRGISKGNLAINEYTNDLYDIISKHRVHFDNTLFQEEIPISKEKFEEKMDYKYITIFGCLGVLIFVFFYFHFNSDLNNILDPMIESVTSTIGVK